MKVFYFIKIIPVLIVLILNAQTSYGYSKNINIKDVTTTVFLDWTILDTVPLYSEPGGTIQKNLLCTNINTDDITMIDIISVNDSMYQISAYSGDNDSVIGIGWIYKSAPIRVTSRLYTPSDNLIIYNNQDQRCPTHILSSFQLPASGLLDVMDVNPADGWIRIRINVASNVVEGWIPKNSYCGNPYTTCG